RDCPYFCFCIRLNLAEQTSTAGCESSTNAIGTADGFTGSSPSSGSNSVTFQWTPSTQGTYYYCCGYHAADGMYGSLAVTAASQAVSSSSAIGVSSSAVGISS